MDYTSEPHPPNALDFNFCGEVLGARYQLGQRLGAGSVATIYLATDRRTGGHVAVKVLHPDHEGAPQEVRRFVQEGQLGAQIRHPNLVHVSDFGGIGGRRFIVMDLVEGQNLASRLKAGRLDYGQSAQLVLDLLAAVGALHERGVVHRDISPTNVLIELVNGRERARLADLGWARNLEEQDLALTEVPLTEPAMVCGTDGFIAPECLRGRRNDVRADIYGIGAVWYMMLTGVAPTAGNPEDGNDNGPPRLDEPTSPPAVRAVLWGALDSWTRRHQSAASMAAALRAAMATSERRSRPTHTRLVAPVLGLLLVLQGASAPGPVSETVVPADLSAVTSQAAIVAEPVASMSPRNASSEQQQPAPAPAPSSSPSTPTPTATASQSASSPILASSADLGRNASASTALPAPPTGPPRRKRTLRNALMACKPDSSALEVVLAPGRDVEVNGGPPFGEIGRCVLRELAKHPAPSHKLTLTL